jgi:hypothetical protein
MGLGPLRLAMNAHPDLAAVNRGVTRRFDAEVHLVAPNLQNLQFYLVTDDYRLAGAAGENQHDRSSQSLSMEGLY